MFVVVVALMARSVLLAGLVFALWAAVPALWGWVPTTVASGSMSPGIEVGDVVIAMPVDPERIAPGQVLLVEDPQHPGELRLHRLVKMNTEGAFILRGDANTSDDSDPVAPEAVQGVGVLRVPWVGLPGLWLRTGDVTALAVAGTGILVLVMIARADRPLGGLPSERRRMRLVRTLSLTTAVGVVGACLVLSPLPSRAAFAATTPNPSSALTAESTYPCLTATPADSPYLRYTFTETAGTTATDNSGNGRTGTLQGGTTRIAGSCLANQSPALLLDGSSGHVTTSATALVGPNTFTIEIWFKTTTTRGGKLIGFGSSATGTSAQYDRHIYMTNAGQLTFGVYPGSVQTITSPAAYNDGAWHHAAATLSSSGMMLYVDGARVATKSSITTGEPYSGYWRVGFDNNNGWTNQPTSYYFAGTVDNPAAYLRALNGTQISAHYSAGH